MARVLLLRNIEGLPRKQASRQGQARIAGYSGPPWIRWRNVSRRAVPWSGTGVSSGWAWLTPRYRCRVVGMCRCLRTTWISMSPYWDAEWKPSTSATFDLWTGAEPAAAGRHAFRRCCQGPRGRSERRIFGNGVVPEDDADQGLPGFLFSNRILPLHEPVVGGFQFPLCWRDKGAARHASILQPLHERGAGRDPWVREMEVGFPGNRSK